MRITQELLMPNEYSRPRKPLQKLLGIVIHWTANPCANAEQTRLYFESKKTGMGGYASVHYIIGQKGEIIQIIPVNEVAYHCGTDRKDPASGKIYTDYARKKFGHYAVHWQTTSPNFCTIGIELCPTDDDGNFSDKTIKSAVELCAYLCSRHRLTAEDITTHHDIVGWKDCPRLWTNQPELLDAFRASVADALARQEV
jgi:N-acetylmuramoyl-L-alanine amidase|nr:MAG TPA: N-acetylmuramoyl-L-alanine amidase [Caudoviricetes sp.]